ncbi:helix-turn-helix domain-containing protein [Paraliomyxa miuraensis]|uniref:helix-turn-helix domain-containing protein n=1 Tax=Paraliomyxa miuraensis TaxID=376150 RepID=UPI00225A87E8|nr:AraC family transcriptional regulator [Paraliomyxa miuraensis]MCX4240574.1 AraC family transcriptional regulator [Paraliomyxa miuraensis]
MADVDTVLHAGAQLHMGRFDCDAGHPLWSRDNRSGPWPLLAFPGTAVEIAQSGRRELVATSNHVVLYNPRQPYRRRLVDPRGDHCVFVAVQDQLLTEVAMEVAPTLAERGERPFNTAWAPAPSNLVLAVSMLARHIERSVRGREAPVVSESPPDLPPDPLMVEESLLGVLASVLSRAAVAAPREGSRSAARRAELSRALERELASSYCEARSLQALASSVGASPFHAARVFRQHTGLTIHAYRHRLRLHAVLERLGDSRVDLTALALETGFCSHSHLTEAFRRMFGAPPSRWRGRLDRRCLRELVARLHRPPAGPHRARS